MMYNCIGYLYTAILWMSHSIFMTGFRGGSAAGNKPARTYKATN